ncbi:hypothetical protein [Nostoc sp. FACHB-280]|uniref:hypothetical protein n=1 Tax=Nostoc sp. FACHB-280 TaxID=2692839 RepID=UPI00168BB4D4|nr:hypothetical protein [Nostoc sp. FACHB-280]MBD2495450.1 hypothetical protein [Nostoc sp. FACHB-280]
MIPEPKDPRLLQEVGDMSLNKLHLHQETVLLVQYVGRIELIMSLFLPSLVLSRFSLGTSKQKTSHYLLTGKIREKLIFLIILRTKIKKLSIKAKLHLMLYLNVLSNKASIFQIRIQNSEASI